MNNLKLELGEFPITLNGEDGTSHMMGYVLGYYRSIGQKEQGTPVIGGLYFNSFFKTSPYSLCFYSREGEFYGHHSPFEKDVTIEFALLEYVSEYHIYPHYWKVLDLKLGKTGVPKVLISEYKQRLSMLKETVDWFCMKEQSINLVYGGDKDAIKYSRLFYPDEPDPNKLIT